MVTTFSKKRRLIAENYNKILYMISENNKPQGVTMRKYRTVAIPIDVFEENFGGDALMDLKNFSDELIEIDNRGGTLKDIDTLLDQEGFFDLKINKDAPKGMTDDELADLIKKEDDRVAKDEDAIREIFDPEDPPTKKASGGLAGILGV